MKEHPLELNEITIEELASMDLKDICLIDVREEYEFIEMRVPGAELLPLGEVPENLDKFPMGEPVYLICATGNRSRVAGDYLIDNKINAVNIEGGTKGWVTSGREYLQGNVDLPFF